MRHLWDQLFLFDIWRFVIVGARFFYFVHLRRRLRQYRVTSDSIAENTIAHNLRGLRDLAVVRSNVIVRPLSTIECLDSDSRVLSIGPRTEGELFNIAAHGFDMRRIRGIDLISYSPLVDLGDMHQLPYEDNSWDAVVCGWVFAYSENKKQAASEVVRVCRPGGVIGVGVEYNPLDAESIERTIGYVPGASDRITSVNQLLDLFNGNVDKIYYSHEPVSSKRDQIGSIVTIFSVAK